MQLAGRADAVAHTERGSEVVLEGHARRLPPAEVPAIVVDGYEAKYGWRLDPRDLAMPSYALDPAVARSWLSADIRGTATRWEFASSS